MRHWLIGFALSVLLVGCANAGRGAADAAVSHADDDGPSSRRRQCRPRATGRRLTGCRLPPSRRRRRRRPAPIPGRIVPVGKSPEGVVVDAATRTVAVAKRDPNELVLLNADTGQVGQRVALPGFVRHLQLADPGGPVLVPVESANALVRVELPSGRALPQILTGTIPHDAAAGRRTDPCSSRTSTAAPSRCCGAWRS